jgi:hypothetical protein
MIKYIILSCVILIPIFSYGQMDSVALNETAKLMVVAERGVKTFESWKTDLTKYVVVKNLQSKGFSKTRFFLLEYRIDNLENIPDSLFKKNEVTYCCDYVVAFYAGIFYRLKGFVNNDFFPFIDELAKTSDEGYILKNTIFSLNKIDTFKKLVATKVIFIEDLDLGCLYQYYQLQAGAFKRDFHMPCLGSCTIKDRRRPYEK